MVFRHKVRRNVDHLVDPSDQLFFVLFACTLVVALRRLRAGHNDVLCLHLTVATFIFYDKFVSVEQSEHISDFPPAVSPVVKDDVLLSIISRPPFISGVLAVVIQSSEQFSSVS